MSEYEVVIKDFYGIKVVKSDKINIPQLDNQKELIRLSRKK